MQKSLTRFLNLEPTNQEDRLFWAKEVCDTYDDYLNQKDNLTLVQRKIADLKSCHYHRQRGQGYTGKD